MRSAFALLACLLAAGCLEGGDAVPPPMTTPPPAASTPATATPHPTATASPAPATPAPAGERSLENVTIEVGQQTSRRQADRLVITDMPAWIAFWAEHKPGEAAPQVDFTTRTVVAAFLGQRSNGCFAVRIEGVRGEGGDGATATATVVTYEPGPGLACTQAITYPYHIVSVEGAARAVSFVETKGAALPPA